MRVPFVFSKKGEKMDLLKELKKNYEEAKKALKADFASGKEEK
jgi:hypothetical protein